jgi:hypothetical protein
MEVYPSQIELLKFVSERLFRFGDGMTETFCQAKWSSQQRSPAAEDKALLLDLKESTLTRGAADRVIQVQHQLAHVLVDSIDASATLLASERVGLFPFTSYRASCEIAGTMLWALDALQQNPKFELKTAKQRCARALTVESKNLHESNVHLQELTGSAPNSADQKSQIETWAAACGFTFEGPLVINGERFPKPSEIGTIALNFSETVFKRGLSKPEYAKGVYALLSTSSHGNFYFYEELTRRDFRSDGRGFERGPALLPALALAGFAQSIAFLAYWSFCVLGHYLGLDVAWVEMIWQDFQSDQFKDLWSLTRTVEEGHR